MKICLNCGKNIENEALFCSACGSGELTAIGNHQNCKKGVDVAPKAKSAKKEKSTLGRVFSIIGLLLPALCLAVFLTIKVLELIAWALTIVPACFAACALFVAIISMIIGPTFSSVPLISNTAMAIFIFCIICIIASSIIWFSLFEFSLLVVSPITDMFSFIIGILAIPAGVLGLPLSIIAIVKKNKLGIFGIAVSILSAITGIISTFVTLLSGFASLIAMLLLILFA